MLIWSKRFAWLKIWQFSVREFLLNFLIAQYQTLLICALLLFLLLKIVRQRQEKKMIQQMNQLLTPIAQDVLLEKIEPAARVEGQNIAAIRRTLHGIDLNAISKSSVTKNNQPSPVNMQGVAQNKMSEVAFEKIDPAHVNAVPTNQSQAEIAVNLKRFDTEFESLLSNMEKRAQMRKK